MAETKVAATPGHAAHHDPVAGKIGMWLFLFTEILLFGTLFMVYAVYLATYKRNFHACSHELNLAMGGTNTIILLSSSLTVVLAIAALERGKRALSVGLLVTTVACAAAFLVIKYFEWTAKFHHDIYPGSPVFLDRDPGEGIFYALYFVMTGFHALHVLIGVVAIGAVARLVGAGRITPERPVILENTGLYWHLVDVVWIFLFPLFYLVR